jgi:acrylyl-CoA reductase (NADPH)
MRPTPDRVEAWTRLARDMDRAKLDAMTTDATLTDLPLLAADIMEGKVRGRVVVDVNG